MRITVHHFVLRTCIEYGSHRTCFFGVDAAHSVEMQIMHAHHRCIIAWIHLSYIHTSVQLHSAHSILRNHRSRSIAHTRTYKSKRNTASRFVRCFRECVLCHLVLWREARQVFNIYVVRGTGHDFILPLSVTCNDHILTYYQKSHVRERFVIGQHMTTWPTPNIHSMRHMTICCRCGCCCWSSSHIALHPRSALQLPCPHYDSFETSDFYIDSNDRWCVECNNMTIFAQLKTN